MNRPRISLGTFYTPSIARFKASLVLSIGVFFGLLTGLALLGYYNQTQTTRFFVIMAVAFIIGSVMSLKWNTLEGLFESQTVTQGGSDDQN